MTLGLSSTAASPFPSKIPEITPYLPPVSSTGTSLSILPACRAVYDAFHNVTELSPAPVARYSLPCFLKGALEHHKACVFSASTILFASYGRSHVTLYTFGRTV